MRSPPFGNACAPLALIATLAGCGNVVVNPTGFDGGATPDGFQVDGASADAPVTADALLPDSTSPGCPRGQTRCGVSCADTLISPFHCGACGRRCATGQVCTEGACATPCRSPALRCGGVCIDVSSDGSNCGGCGVACGAAQACASGRCACPIRGQIFCAGVGCIDPTGDLNNCGSCGRVCGAGGSCRSGRCGVPSGVRYAVTTDSLASESWVEACSATGHQRLLTSVDDASAITTLPFAFTYWGTNLPERSPVNVCTNGWIGLDGVMNSSLTGRVPDPTAPNAVVAAHWVDLVTGPTGVCVATTGAAPSRRTVFEWSDVGYFAARETRVTFEIVLHEGGVIELLYRSLASGRPGESGLESFDGFDGLSLCSPDASQCPRSSGARVRLVPTR